MDDRIVKAGNDVQCSYWIILSLPNSVQIIVLNLYEVICIGEFQHFSRKNSHYAVELVCRCYGHYATIETINLFICCKQLSKK